MEIKLSRELVNPQKKPLDNFKLDMGAEGQQGRSPERTLVEQEDLPMS